MIHHFYLGCTNFFNWFKGANHRTVTYTITNMGSKGFAAITQLYAIFVFTRMHTQDEAALIFLLMGYAIWFQVFDFGLAQTLQNKFNAKQMSADEMLIIIVAHYLCMLVIAGFVVSTPYLANALLSPNKSATEIQAFSLGAAILLTASNNVMSQRFLLVFNKGLLGNALIMLQSALAVVGLASYEYWNHADLLVAIFLYLGPQVLVHMPLVLGWIFKLLRNSSRIKDIKLGSIIHDALGFWGLGVLAAIFLGSDYYFAAHYMNGQQVVSYHLVTRIFFISFVPYYAYVQHSARRLSVRSLKGTDGVVKSILKDSVSIGLVMVFTVYGVVAFLDGTGVFERMTIGGGIGQSMLFSAFVYYTIRVCLDVGLVVMLGLNARAIMYKVYALETVVGLSLMSVIVPKYGGQGLFTSLSLACALGLALLIHQGKKMGIVLTNKG